MESYMETQHDNSTGKSGVNRIKTSRVAADMALSVLVETVWCLPGVG
jgi:hypothetical protein